MKPDKRKVDPKSQYRINEEIRVREVRVVGDNGATVMSTREALELAQQRGEDLVEISPNAEPPVCRIIDYSKFLYQQKKKAKEISHDRLRSISRKSVSALRLMTTTITSS